MIQTPGQVIVVGSQRSGTTEIFNVLTQVLGYSGDGESHLWPAVSKAWAELDAAVERMGGMQAPAYRHFTIGKVGVDNIKAKLARVLTDIYQQRFGDRWVDKTPGVEMVEAVTLLAEILPKAKFLFMRRRGIENVMSKLRRFPKRPFESACEEWSDTMRAWLKVREVVQGRSLEIDQMTMAQFPGDVARNLCKFLDCESSTDVVTACLSETRSEQTQATSNQTIALNETGWTVEMQRIFCDLCAPMMAMYGYSFESQILLDTAIPRPIPLIFEKTQGGVSISSKTGKTALWWQGLRMFCKHDGGPEIVTLGNIIASGQNIFETSAFCAGAPGIDSVSIEITIVGLGGESFKESFVIQPGIREEISLPVSKLDGPVSIELRAAVLGTKDDVTRVDLLRPRLIFKEQ